VRTVQTSSYAYLAGIPVALLGLVAYLLILVALRRQGDNALFTGYVLTLVGFGFSLYLTYREVFTIHAICSWCVSSAIVFTLLAVVQTMRVMGAGRPAPSRAAQIA
jgi:uncharacterized membrane protein